MFLSVGRSITNDEIIAALLVNGDFSVTFYTLLENQLEKISKDMILREQIKTMKIVSDDISSTIAAVLNRNFVFDLQQFAVLNWLESASSSLITNISVSTRMAIQQILTAVGGLDVTNPVVAAKLIRPQIGILPRHSSAVSKVYDRALKGYLKQGIPEQTAITKALKISSRRSQFLLNYRSKNIARTELHRAWSFAETEAALDAQSQGIFSKPMGMQWLTAVDERVCPICGPMEGDIVPLGSEFALTDIKGGERTEIGTTRDIHAHPSCRCTGIIVEL